MICRAFGWKRRRGDGSFQRAEVTGSHLLAARGRCGMQVVVGGGSVFFQTSSLPGSWKGVCFTVGFQCRTQLLSTFSRHWLHYDSVGKVFKLGYVVQAAHKCFLTGKYSSVVISHPQYWIPIGQRGWSLHSVDGRLNIEMKIVLSTRFRLSIPNFDISSSSCVITFSSNLYTDL